MRGGANVSDFCSLPPDSPLRRIRREWMDEQNVPGDGEDLLLVGIWGDAAAFHTRDSISMLIFSVLSGLSHERHWVATWSKRITCRCGCQGRCTFAVFRRLFAWVMTAWKARKFPSFRDDGVAFNKSKYRGDKRRANRARIEPEHLCKLEQVWCNKREIGHG